MKQAEEKYLHGDKIRSALYITPKLKKEVVKISKKDSRSITKVCEIAIAEYVVKRKEDG